MQNTELIPHLFRTEYRKIVSVLCKFFGSERIDVAEDIAGDTFLTAAETWGITGIPANPSAWLYSVAKNKAKNFLQRDSVFRNKVFPALKKEYTSVSEEEPDLSVENVFDSQLGMMFAICHPCISGEAQIGLSLRILCGFGIEEIAEAFLSNKETIHKRLVRAKEKLKSNRVPIEIPPLPEIQTRITAVLATIYLLFNEGYRSSSGSTILRKELCMEAIRLCEMLTQDENTNRPETNALLALMNFHASRLEARSDDKGETILYEDQDPNLWNYKMIQKGEYFLSRSASGNRLTKYHLEAGIAYWHTQKSDTPEKWESILQLYNHLLQLEYSPVAALNRTYALSKANGKSEAIREAEKLDLRNNRFYFALLGELYTGIDNEKAKENYRIAYSLAKTEADKSSIRKKLDSI
ncbi:RNA polymerase sigma factor [Leptospira wolffii]|uniref:RNA polymerase sigma factor n=1 Tax=Leptospira wolffii TaxID=409998 RepID=A0ABV5BT12_9LEPT